MNTWVVIATVRCAADYDALLPALVHARARVLCEYRARSHAYDKYQWLDEKAEKAKCVYFSIIGYAREAGCVWSPLYGPFFLCGSSPPMKVSVMAQRCELCG